MIVVAMFFNMVVVQSQSYNFIKFNQNEGLNHSQILDISQDKNGNLWLGTPTRSIYRFDGKKFYEYKIYIPGNSETLRTLKVQTDFENRIWILSNHGLLKFNGSEAIIIPGSNHIMLGSNSILSIDSNNQLWGIDEMGEVFTVEEDSVQVLSEVKKALQNKVRGYFEDENGNMCFYSLPGKVLRLSKSGQLLSFDLPWDINGTLQALSQSQNKYLIAASSGIFEFSTQKKKLNKIAGSIIEQPMISKIFYDRHNVIWGLAGSQIFTIDKDQKIQWLSGYSKHENNDVICLFMDKDSDIWIGVDIIGLLKYREHIWNKIEDTQGKHITAIAEIPIEKKIIFGTYSDGILGLKSNVLSGKPITSLSISSGGNIFAGTLKTGLFEIKSNLTEAKPVFLSNQDQDVYGVRCWENKTIVGAQGGLYVVQSNSEVKKYSNLNGKNNDVSNPIVIKDNIYFSGMTSGLMKLSGDSIQHVGPGFLKNSLVYNIEKYIGGGYIVTGEFPSILFFDDSFAFQRLISLDSIASNALLIEFIDEHNFILGSNDGLFKITLINDSIASAKKYGRADGYAGEEMYVGASIYSDKNEIVIGTVDGAYSFNPKSEWYNTSAPSTFITEVNSEVDNLKAHLDGYIPLPKDLTLNYDENSLTFSFDAISLTNPYNIKFQYRLLGLESDWSASGTSQQVTYSNLPPGKFTFQVQSMDESMKYGEIAEYAFFISPAFWQTPFFYFASVFSLIVFGLLIIWGISAYRISRHKTIEGIKMNESQRIRKQMSMDFHDEMGNKLASMLAQASLLKMKHTDTDLYKNFDFFEKNAYAIYHGTKDFIWMIDVKSNNLNEIILYLRDFGFNFFERNQIQFKFYLGDNEREIVEAQLPDGFNRQLVLIFKEAMTNSLKHSGCSRVSLSANKIKNGFEISFEDDGAWKESKNAGNGIVNMKTRAEKMNAKLAVVNSLGGTKVTLNINSNHNL